MRSGFPWRLDPRGLRSALASGIVSSDGGVDLSGVEFVTPGGMVGLACLLEAWTAELGRIPLVLPNEEITGYLERMNLFEHFGDRLSIDGSIIHLQTRSRYQASLSELQTVLGYGQAKKVTKRFCEALSQRGLADEKVERCYRVISEALNNAVDHADSPCGAYTAIQSWGKLDQVAVAVADAGVGIPHTIRAHPEARRADLSDHELIELATKHMISSKHRVAGRGGGFTSALRSVRAGRGKLTIWSGHGWVALIGVDNVVAAERVFPFRGTCVEAVFPLS